MPQNVINSTFEFTVLLPAALGVIGGGTANLLLRIWQYGHESWGAIVDSLCKNLEELGSLGTEYWCAAGTNAKEDSIREAKILGLQARIDGLMEGFYDRVHSSRRDLYVAEQARIRDAATGGSFQSSPIATPSTAIILQSAISDLIVHIRREEIRVPQEKLNNAVLSLFIVVMLCITIGVVVFG